MGCRYSREELGQIEAFVEEGLTTREIAERLGRSEAGIRNLCYRKRLMKKAQDDAKALLQRRDELQRSVGGLEAKQEELLTETEMLETKTQTVEHYLQLERSQLELLLTEALVTLKGEKPELFFMSDSEQMGLLLRFLFRIFTK